MKKTYQYWIPWKNSNCKIFPTPLVTFALSMDLGCLDTICLKYIPIHFWKKNEKQYDSNIAWSAAAVEYTDSIPADE